MPVFPYSTSAWTRGRRGHRLAQLALSFQPNQTQHIVEKDFEESNADDQSREEDVNKANREVMALDEGTEFMVSLKQVDTKHSEEMRQAREELQTALKKHQDDETSWQKKEQDYLAEHRAQETFRNDMIDRISTAASTQGVEITAALERVDLHNVTTADVQALFNAYSNNSSAARQQNADQRVRNERKVRTDNEHFIKQSLSVVAQACNEPFSMDNSAQSSVTSITRAVATMANEHDSYKKLIDRTKADTDVLIRQLLLLKDNGEHSSLQEADLRVKFQALSPLISDFAEYERKKVASWVSKELHRGLRPLKLAPFIDDGDHKRSVQTFVAQVVDHFNAQAKIEEKLLGHITETASTQKVTLVLSSSKSLKDCVPHYVQEVGTELKKLRDANTHLETERSTHAETLSRLRRILEDAKELLPNMPITGHDAPIVDVLQGFVETVSPQVLDLQTVRDDILPLLQALQPGFPGSDSVNEDVSAYVSLLASERDKAVKDSRDIVSSKKTLESELARLIADNDLGTMTTADPTLEQLFHFFNQSLNGRLDASIEQCRAAIAALDKISTKYGGKVLADRDQQADDLISTVDGSLKEKQDAIDQATNFIVTKARSYELSTSRDKLQDHLMSLVAILEERMKKFDEMTNTLSVFQSAVDQTAGKLGLMTPSPMTLDAILTEYQRRINAVGNDSTTFSSKLQQVLTNHAADLEVSLDTNADVEARLVDLCVRAKGKLTKVESQHANKLKRVLDGFEKSTQKAADDLSVAVALPPQPTSPAGAEELAQWVDNRITRIGTALLSWQGVLQDSANRTLGDIAALVQALFTAASFPDPPPFDSAHVQTWITNCTTAFQAGVTAQRTTVVGEAAQMNSALVGIFMELLNSIWQITRFPPGDWTTPTAATPTELRAFGLERVRDFNRNFKQTHEEIRLLKETNEKTLQAKENVFLVALARLFRLLEALGMQPTQEAPAHGNYTHTVLGLYLQGQIDHVITRYTNAMEAQAGADTKATKILDAAQQSFAILLQKFGVKDRMPTLSIHRPEEAVAVFKGMADTLALPFQKLLNSLSREQQLYKNNMEWRNQYISLAKNNFRYLANDLGFETKDWPVLPFSEANLRVVEEYFHTRRNELAAAWVNNIHEHDARVHDLESQLTQAKQNVKTFEKLRADKKTADSTITELLQTHGKLVKLCNEFLTLLAQKPDEQKPNLPMLVLDPTLTTREVTLQWHEDFKTAFDTLMKKKLDKRDRHMAHEACKKIGPSLRNLAHTVSLGLGLLKDRLVDGDKSDLLHVRDMDGLPFVVGNIKSIEEWIEEATRQLNTGLLDFKRTADGVAWQMRKAENAKWVYKDQKTQLQDAYEELKAIFAASQTEKEALKQIMRALLR